MSEIRTFLMDDWDKQDTVNLIQLVCSLVIMIGCWTIS